MMSVDELRVCVLLQDCADQLSVLGNIIRPGAETVSNNIKFTSTSEQRPLSVYKTVFCTATVLTFIILLPLMSDMLVELCCICSVMANIPSG